MDVLLLNHYDEIQAFQSQSHSLWIPASQVSALSGFHPYTDLPEVFLTLVYQGQLGNLLQHRDAQLLGMTLTSKKESLMDIASRGGEDVQKYLKISEDIKSGKSRLENVDEAKELKENVLKHVTKSKDLSKNDIQQLVDGVSHNIHTGFGHLHEEDALDEYEKICGCTIRGRNTETKRWDFSRVDLLTEETTSSFTVVPMSDLQSRYSSCSTSSSRNNSTDTNTASAANNNNNKTSPKASDEIKSGMSSDEAIDLGGGDEGNNTPPKRSNAKPFFSILGSIDGLRDEPYVLPKTLQSSESLSKEADESTKSEEDTWSLRTLVVECKHRMNRFFLPAPFYEIIQCVVYCLMFKTEAGEIVQVMRNRPKEDSPTPEEMASLPWIDWTTQPTKIEKPFDIRVSKVFLDDPKSNHRQNFYNVIVPRLGNFTDAVYSYRRDDSKRFAMLLAYSSATCSGNDEEIWNLLFQECPYLLDCDTAFHRKRKAATANSLP
jgi:hypothetical protein